MLNSHPICRWLLLGVVQNTLKAYSSSYFSIQQRNQMSIEVVANLNCGCDGFVLLAVLTRCFFFLRFSIRSLDRQLQRVLFRACTMQLHLAATTYTFAHRRRQKKKWQGKSDISIIFEHLFIWSNARNHKHKPALFSHFVRSTLSVAFYFSACADNRRWIRWVKRGIFIRKKKVKHFHCSTAWMAALVWKNDDRTYIYMVEEKFYYSSHALIY